MSYKSSPFKMAPKSPAMKALKGEQVNLPEGLKKAIEASPAKQTSKTQRRREHDARMQERSDNPRVAAHNDKLGHESPRQADYVVNAFNENAGNWGYSMKPVGKPPMKRPNTASRKDNTSI